MGIGAFKDNTDGTKANNIGGAGKCLKNSRT